jgi:hypothetical protein
LLHLVPQAARRRFLATSSTSNNSSSVSSSLADMPAEVLVRVMSHVPLLQRLGACALACRDLQAAAVAATSVFSLHSIASQQQMDAAAAWLERHSRPALKQLCLIPKDVWVNGLPILRLPWRCLTQLETLQLHGVLAPDNGAAWQAAPAAGSSSIGLGMLTGLQRLELKTLLAPANGWQRCSAYSTALGSALGQLVQLTALTLSFADRTPIDCAAVLAQCSNLTRLQHADMGGLGMHFEPMSLQDLPASLTQLTLRDAVLEGNRHDVRSSSNSGQLSALLKLELSDLMFRPSNAFVQMLSIFPQLQVLVCNMHRRLYVTSADVLAGVRQLQHLRALSLIGAIGWHPAAAADYAALTASSYLTSLTLCNCDLVAAAAQYMFRPGLVLPQLQQVSIIEPEVSGRDLWSEGFDGAEIACLQLGAGNAANLARCCPVLRTLELVFIQEGLEASELQPLLQLSALTHLGIGGEGCGAAVVKEVLAQLTGGAAVCTSQSGIVGVACIVMQCVYQY